VADIKNKINIDDKLFLNTYNADTVSHLIIKDQGVCANCKEKPCTEFCPARVFEGCLECGACRIACPNNNIDWNYPRGGFGIQFRLA